MRVHLCFHYCGKCIHLDNLTAVFESVSPGARLLEMPFFHTNRRFGRDRNRTPVTHTARSSVTRSAIHYDSFTCVCRCAHTWPVRSSPDSGGVTKGRETKRGRRLRHLVWYKSGFPISPSHIFSDSSLLFCNIIFQTDGSSRFVSEFALLFL